MTIFPRPIRQTKPPKTLWDQLQAACTPTITALRQVMAATKISVAGWSWQNGAWHLQGVSETWPVEEDFHRHQPTSLTVLCSSRHSTKFGLEVEENASANPGMAPGQCMAAVRLAWNTQHGCHAFSFAAPLFLHAARMLWFAPCCVSYSDQSCMLGQEFREESSSGLAAPRLDFASWKSPRPSPALHPMCTAS